MQTTWLSVGVSYSVERPCNRDLLRLSPRPADLFRLGRTVICPGLPRVSLRSVAAATTAISRSLAQSGARSSPVPRTDMSVGLLLLWPPPHSLTRSLPSHPSPYEGGCEWSRGGERDGCFGEGSFLLSLRTLWPLTLLHLCSRGGGPSARCAIWNPKR